MKIKKKQNRNSKPHRDATGLCLAPRADRAGASSQHGVSQACCAAFSFHARPFLTLAPMFCSERPCLYLDLKVFPLWFSLVFHSSSGYIAFPLPFVREAVFSNIHSGTLSSFRHLSLNALISASSTPVFCISVYVPIACCVVGWLCMYVLLTFCSITKSKTLQSMQTNYKVYAVGVNLSNSLLWPHCFLPHFGRSSCIRHML